MEIPERSFETPAARVGAATILLAALTGCGGSAVAAGSTVPAILFSPIASTSAFLMTLDGQELRIPAVTTGARPSLSRY